MNIYVLNTLQIGMDTVNILKKHLRIAGVIGLSQREATDKISGYVYLKSYCEDNGFAFVETEQYSLTSPSDKQRLLCLDIDVLIVSGWQRLIPDWLIQHCKICAIGSHGSTHGITEGRGRSPQNWALLLGQQKFFISIFKIDAGIDSGSIIDTQAYDLSVFDDIKSSYYKVSWLTAHMIVEYIDTIERLVQPTKEQLGNPRYLPQRLPEDGRIDWSRTSRQLYDFVRALTKPYPGAFSCIDNTKIVIWRARPFQIHEFDDSPAPGQVVKVFSNNDFLVKTGDGLLLVEDYSLEPDGTAPPMTEGMVLPSYSFKKQMQDIVDRHYSKYPQLLLSDDIMNLL